MDTTRSLTTVAQPTYELGRRAAEMLVQRLTAPKASRTAEHVVLEGKLVVRESSGALDGRRSTRPASRRRALVDAD
jgi:LacI family fructose operon transcriptional repressor